MYGFSRRQFVVGGAIVAANGLAGCAGGNNGDGMEDIKSPTETETETQTAEERVVSFLKSGLGADNFDGDFTDATNQDEVTVKVGAEGNGGAFAFEPPAFKILTGATIIWTWTGKGGQHNVVSVDDSDFEFRSGGPTESDDKTFKQSFNDPGVGLYRCDNHKGIGAKGGFVVE